MHCSLKTYTIVPNNYYYLLPYASGSTVALCRSQAQVKEEGTRVCGGEQITPLWNIDEWNPMKKSEWKTPRYGRRWEKWWTPTWAKAQDTRASPDSLETHLVRKWGDISTPTGAEPMEQWMDGRDYHIQKLALNWTYSSNWNYVHPLNLPVDYCLLISLVPFKPEQTTKLQ